MQQYAIIVAGGSGSRMNSNTPKQFMLLNGEPVLMHSLRAFHQQNRDTQLIVVLNDLLHDEWQALSISHGFNLPHHLLNGGETRFDSVSNALIYLQTLPDFLAGSSLVAVHDAARPLVTPELISRSFADARQFGSGIATVRSSNTVRIETAPGITETIDRNKVFLVQTPQVFKASILLKAYEQAYEPAFTDDASVVEKAGYHLHLTGGDTRNIKITFPEDIHLAESLIQSK
jgi:2-C-methyl-D-erythritol 4-phosphate cytidylyltransferase